MNREFTEEEIHIIFRVKTKMCNLINNQENETKGKKLPKKNFRTPRPERQRYLIENAHQCPAYERENTHTQLQTHKLGSWYETHGTLKWGNWEERL